MSLVWVEKNRACTWEPIESLLVKGVSPSDSVMYQVQRSICSTASSSAGPRPRGGTGQEFPT